MTRNIITRSLVRLAWRTITRVDDILVRHLRAEICDHLLAAAGHFHLRVFQKPTGLDFKTFAESLRKTD